MSGAEAEARAKRFDQMEKDVAERTYKTTRLYIAATFLSGLLASSKTGSQIAFNDTEREFALKEAECLMRMNEERKVVML